MDTQETDSDLVNVGWNHFWNKRGISGGLLSSHEPHCIRNMNAYTAMGIPSPELEPEELFLRAASRADRFRKYEAHVKKLEEERLKQAEKDAAKG